MKLQAEDIKKGMEIKFGWNQWLNVESIEIDYQNQLKL